LQGNLSEETLVDANSPQAATFEGESLQKEATDVSEVEALQEEPPEKSSTLDLPTAAADGAEGSETAEPESGLTLAEWNYTEENGGIVLTSLKDNNAKNVVIPGEFTDAPGKQVYIKGSNTKYPNSSTSLEFREIDGKKVKVANASLASAFEVYGLERFNGSGLNTTGVTTMDMLFHGCRNLTEITGMANWDTSAVTNMD
jgi:bacterial surface protein 26-residue repeat